MWGKGEEVHVLFPVMTDTLCDWLICSFNLLFHFRNRNLHLLDDLDSTLDSFSGAYRL
jgi:hypothetical protein